MFVPSHEIKLLISAYATREALDESAPSHSFSRAVAGGTTNV